MRIHQRRVKSVPMIHCSRCWALIHRLGGRHHRVNGQVTPRRYHTICVLHFAQSSIQRLSMNKRIACFIHLSITIHQQNNNHSQNKSLTKFSQPKDGALLMNEWTWFSIMYSNIFSRKNIYEFKPSLHWHFLLDTI